MTYRLKVQPEAVADILEAVDWHERQQSGLGATLADEIRFGVRSLRINPLLYRIRHTQYRVRWMLLHRFPYRIIFVVESDLITVLAVTHTKRHDKHWKDRV
jgi:toxin ParE1/3/4